MYHHLTQCQRHHKWTHSTQNTSLQVHV